MRTVQILGAAPNIERCSKTLPVDTERWCLNNHKIYENHLFPAAVTTYTRWFNLHPRKQMDKLYKRSVEWYRQQDKPIYLQEADPTIPMSRTFPRDEIQRAFAIDGRLMTYFTSSLAWCMAYAMLTREFDRIELCGFYLTQTRAPIGDDTELRPGDSLHGRQRPCAAYWVQRARDIGIEVVYPHEVDLYGPFVPGDAARYQGPLYGYETKYGYV
jgi:hypothetical protein